VSHQDGFGNDRTQPTRSSKPHDDDGMKKKSEYVAHAQDGIRRKKLKNSGRLRNSLPTHLVEDGSKSNREILSEALCSCRNI
jgi:hypothetical protein